MENKKASNPKGMVNRPGRQKHDYFGFSLFRETSILGICDLKGWEKMGYLYFQGEFRWHIFLFVLRTKQQTIQGTK